MAFVYCWTDHKNEKLYVGARKGTPTDGYVCSSKIVKQEIARRPQDFTRQIIAEGVWEDMYSLETSILNSVDARNNPDYYNQHNNSKGFYNKGQSLVSRKRIAVAKTGTKHSEETKAKMRKAKLGKKRPLEFREKMKHIGLTQSIEKRTKISNKMKAVWQSRNKGVSV